MSLSIDAIKVIAGRKGNEFLNSQVNLEASLLGKLKREDQSGQVAIINVQGGAVSSVGFISGGGAYPTASSPGVSQIQARQVSMIGLVNIPIDSAQLVSGKGDGVNLVKERMASVGEQLHALLNRACMDTTASAIEADATISGGEVTVSVSDVSAFREGMSFTWNDGGTRNANSFEVLSVTDNDDGTGSVTFSTSATGTLSAADDTLELRDVASKGFVSLSDLAGTGDVYGQTISNAGWAGTTIVASGVLTNPRLRTLDRKVKTRGAKRPNLYVMSDAQHQAYDEAQIGNRRYTSGKDSLDPFGTGKPAFAGAEILVDSFCPNKKVFGLHTDHVKLGQWSKGFVPLQNRGDGPAEVNTSTYDYTIRVHGHFQLLCNKRSTVGMLDALTIA